MTNTTTTHRLIAHPSTPCWVVANVAVQVAMRAPNRLHLRYELVGDCDRIVFPPRSGKPVFADNLWQHTCFEAFIATPTMPAYQEFNFSPSGHWAVYDFSAPRVRATASCRPALPPAIGCAHTPRRFALTAEIVLEAPPTHRQQDLVLGLSAVLEQTDGTLCHWALDHASDRPDFHARASWLATLPSAL